MSDDNRFQQEAQDRQKAIEELLAQRGSTLAQSLEVDELFLDEQRKARPAAPLDCKVLSDEATAAEKMTRQLVGNVVMSPEVLQYMVETKIPASVFADNSFRQAIVKNAILFYKEALAAPTADELSVMLRKDDLDHGQCRKELSQCLQEHIPGREKYTRLRLDGKHSRAEYDRIAKKWPGDIDKQYAEWCKIKPKKEGLPEMEDSNILAERHILRPNELIEGILHKGSKLSFSGCSKGFKTWFLFNMALSVAYGKPLLGRQTQQARVLICNFELQEYFAQQRLKTLIREMGIDSAPGRLDIWNLHGYAAKHDVIFPKIIERIKGRDYGLVILDPLYKIYGDEKENANEAMGLLLNSMDKIATATGAAVCFGAHFSKGNQSAKSPIDRISGAGTLGRDPDSILTLTEHEEENCYTLDCILRNMPPVAPSVLRWDFPLFTVTDLNPAALKQPGFQEKWTDEQLVEGLSDKPLSVLAWAGIVGCDRSTITARLPRLTEQGLIRQEHGGKWSRTRLATEIEGVLIG